MIGSQFGAAAGRAAAKVRKYGLTTQMLRGVVLPALGVLFLAGSAVDVGSGGRWPRVALALPLAWSSVGAFTVLLHFLAHLSMELEETKKGRRR